jgi:hypothetical protein
MSNVGKMSVMKQWLIEYISTVTDIHHDRDTVQAVLFPVHHEVHMGGHDQ